jgi:hypothetical protein
MIETIFALLMFLNGKLENYSPKANVADCLEQKRKVERVAGPTENWSCKEIKAIVEVDKHGIKRIKEIKESWRAKFNQVPAVL